MNANFITEFKNLAAQYTKLKSNRHKTIEETTQQRQIKKIFHELNQEDRKQIKRLLAGESLDTKALRDKWTKINAPDYQFQQSKHSLVRRIKNIFHRRIRKKELIQLAQQNARVVEKAEPDVAKSLSNKTPLHKSSQSQNKKRTSSTSSSTESQHPNTSLIVEPIKKTLSFDHFLDELQPNEPLTQEFLIEFFIKNRGPIVSLAFENPGKWLKFSQAIRSLLDENQEDLEIAALLDRLDLSITTKFGIHTFYSSITPSGIRALSEFPNELQHMLVNPSPIRINGHYNEIFIPFGFNPLANEIFPRCGFKQTLKNSFFALDLNSRKLLHAGSSLQTAQDVIERMKLLYKANPGEKTVFGVINLEKFIHFFNSNALPIFYFVHNLNDLDQILPQLEYLNLLHSKSTIETLNQELSKLESPRKILSNASNVKSLQLSGFHIQFLNQLPHPEKITTLLLDITNNAADLSNLKLLVNLKSLRLVSGKTVSCDLTPLFKAIGGLTQLEHLDLQRLLVFAKGFKYLSPLTQLKALNLTGNCLSDFDFQTLKNFVNLELLILESSNIRDLSLKHIQACSKLKELYLGTAFRCLTDDGLEALKDLPLEKLSLESESITGKGLYWLPKTLTFLNLSNCPEFDLMCLDHLTRLENLQELDLSLGTVYMDDPKWLAFEKKVHQLRWNPVITGSKGSFKNPIRISEADKTSLNRIKEKETLLYMA